MTVKQRILAVDDEPKNLKILLLGLGDEWEVRTALSGEDALSALESYVPDVVLLDIMMPGMDGYEVCRRIKADSRFEFTKVILVSGKAMIEERLQGYDVGADDYLMKPFIPEELTAKVRVFMRLTRMERELAKFNESLEEQVADRTKKLVDAEAKLVNVAKFSALGEMAGGIAHEINTPLAVINLLNGQMTEDLASDKFDKASFEKMAHKIDSTVQRIAKIINGLRAFARGDEQEPTHSCSVAQIVSDTIDLCGERFKESKIPIDVKYSNPQVRAQCRSTQVSQVILNLLNNAHDAIVEQSEKWIKVEVDESEKDIAIRITDAGKGLPDSVKEKLFQPFFTTKQIGKGTGLGLSISKGLLEAQKGSLEFDANSENTSFVVKIPKAAA